MTRIQTLRLRRPQTVGTVSVNTPVPNGTLIHNATYAIDCSEMPLPLSL